MSSLAQVIAAVDTWYGSLRLYQDHLPARGTIAAALHVLHRLRSDYQLDISTHVAGGEAQIAGLSTGSIERVLAEFGERRTLSAVAGRSNRGARGDAAKLLESMRQLHLERLPAEQRERVIVAMQRHIVVAYVGLYFSVKRVKALFDPNSATAHFIDAILHNARQSGKAGAVAEHLVGAKLSLRFPAAEIRNKRFTTSDTQGGFFGDFEIGTTVFHVTVSPMPELFQKLKTDAEQGRRIYLLVPRSQLIGAKQNAEMVAAGRVAVESIESFVATNIDELSGFDGEQLRTGFRHLLDRYNERVDEVELDRSLLIEVPPNLG